MAETAFINKWHVDQNTPAAKALMGKKPSEGEKAPKPGDLTSRELKDQVNRAMSRIREVADYRKGVKGTMQKALRKIAAMVDAATNEMCGRS